jgi:hypothetical protein
MPMNRHAKTEWQRYRRAAVAISAGRPPHRTGRPPTGRKASKHHGDRIGQRARARARQLRRDGDTGRCEPRHPILEEALIVASRHARADHGSVIFRPLFEEAVCVAALAICAGEDPDLATVTFVRAERDWMARTTQLYADAA